MVVAGGPLGPAGGSHDRKVVDDRAPAKSVRSGGPAHSRGMDRAGYLARPLLSRSSGAGGDCLTANPHLTMWAIACRASGPETWSAAPRRSVVSDSAKLIQVVPLSNDAKDLAPDATTASGSPAGF
jgi:hypothetical protein